GPAHQAARRTGLAEQLGCPALLPLPSVPGRQRDPGRHQRRPESRRHAGLADMIGSFVPGSEATHMATIVEHAQKMLRGEAPPPPIGRLLGFVLKSIEPGWAIFEMAVDDRHHNPMGTPHGGVYCDLADAAMGYAYAATLGEGETFTTV